MIRSASGLIAALLRSLGSSAPADDSGRKAHQQRSIDNGPSCAPGDGDEVKKRSEQFLAVGSQLPAHPRWNYGCGGEAALRSTNPIRKVGGERRTCFFHAARQFGDSSSDRLIPT